MTRPHQDAAEIAASLKGAHRRLAQRVSSRWIMGTGICHSCVGHDLEAQGLVESRVRHGQRQIRAMPLGLQVRAILASQAGDA